MTISLLVGIGIGLVTPYLVRVTLWWIREHQENSVPISKERTEMFLKDDQK